MARSAVLRTVRDWEARLAPHIAGSLRKGRRGKAGESWYIDETYVKVGGQWTYLYRAIDRDGNLVDVRLSETRDMTAAKAFFADALEVTGQIPDRVTSDGQDAYPGAIRDELGGEVLHRTNQYLNNHLEQDHRGIKQRYYPMRGFKSFVSASRFCRAFDELRNFLRPQRRRRQSVSLAHRRFVHICRVGEVIGIMETATA